MSPCWTPPPPSPILAMTCILYAPHNQTSDNQKVRSCSSSPILPATHIESLPYHSYCHLHLHPEAPPSSPIRTPSSFMQYLPRYYSPSPAPFRRISLCGRSTPASLVCFVFLCHEASTLFHLCNPFSATGHLARNVQGKGKVKSSISCRKFLPILSIYQGFANP